MRQPRKRDAFDAHRARGGGGLFRAALEPAAVDEDIRRILEAERRDGFVAGAMVVDLVVEEHGELRAEDAAQRDALLLELRGGGKLLFGAPALPVAERDARRACRGGERERPEARAKRVSC